MNKVIKNIKIFLLWILGIVMALIILGALIFAVATENDKRNLKESRERAVIREETERKAKAEREAMEAARTLYDPDLCKTDAGGMVYYAAGNHVFRFPYQSDKPLYSRKNTPYESPVTIPIADETELEGCPKNPLRGGRVPYMRTNFKVSDGQWVDVTGEVIRSHHIWLAFSGGVRPNLIASSYRRQEILKEKIEGRICFERAIGFYECFDPALYESYVPPLPAGTFKISANVRESIDGRDLYFSARSYPGPDDKINHLVVRFSLYNALIINLEVKTTRENFTLMIDHERRARKYIENAHYRSYEK